MVDSHHVVRKGISCDIIMEQVIVSAIDVRVVARYEWGGGDKIEDNYEVKCGGNRDQYQSSELKELQHCMQTVGKYRNIILSY